MRPDARAWVVKAERDYQTTRLLAARLKRDFYESAGFHAQQAVEKYLKAFMSDRRMPFQKVHDLTALVNAAARADATLARFAGAVSPLNRFAVGFRYPGAEPRKSDVRRAVRSAERLRAELRRRLGLRP